MCLLGHLAEQIAHEVGATPLPGVSRQDCGNGVFDYMVNGRLMRGVALIAYPAQYGASGIMSFILNHDGVVYQRDLGPKTAEQAAAIKAFDPGPGWTKVETTAK